MKNIGKSLAKLRVVNAYRQAYTQAIITKQGYQYPKLPGVDDLNRTATDTSLLRTPAGCCSLSRLPELVRHLFRWQAAASQPVYSRKQVYAYV